jgi:hypothetical protein
MEPIRRWTSPKVTTTLGSPHNSRQLNTRAHQDQGPLLSRQLSQDTLDWLKTNYFKTELELGHCLRTPAEGPCECDLYLRCPKFFTTSEYTPRLRARLAREQQLIQDAVECGWPCEAERHTAISGRICELLSDLGESTRPDHTDPEGPGSCTSTG